jgi:hypothetical protein
MQSLRLRCALRHGEQLASTSDIGSAVFAVGEQPVVTDAMEAFGQHMDQEAPDELMCRQGHGLVPAGPLDPVILPFEGDTGLSAEISRLLAMATRWV